MGPNVLNCATTGASPGLPYVTVTTDSSRQMQDPRYPTAARKHKIDLTDGKVKALICELMHMLTYKRPADSASELAFIRKFLSPLDCQMDAYGNIWKSIPMADGKASPILWSSHTDTVHNHEGRQKLKNQNGIITSLSKDCLGADDTTGVWIMRNMILAGIPGTYIFHRGEEIGGKGSNWIANNLRVRLKEFNYAIAFDRKGYNDIITHQLGRCCSDNFAACLSKTLGGLDYRADSGGIFTDTANYTDIIPECSNLSIGYGAAHGPSEWQDAPHAVSLLFAILEADFSQLKYFRDPTAQTKRWNSNRKDDWPKEQSQSPDTGGDDDALYEAYLQRHKMTTSREAKGKRSYVIDQKELEMFCAMNPDRVAEFLVLNGFSVGDIEDETEAGWGG